MPSVDLHLLRRLLWHHLQSLDLRFPERSCEVEFQRFFGKHLARNASCCAVFAVSVLFTSIVQPLKREMGGGLNEFEWDLSDPRTVFFCVKMSGILWLTVVMLIGYAYVRLGRLQTLNWETTSVICGCITMVASMSPWHVARFCGREPEQVWQHFDATGGAFLHALASQTVIAVFSLVLPIRCCMLWICQAWGCGLVICLIGITGFPNTDCLKEFFCMFVSLAVLSFIGSMCHEKRVRREWSNELEANGAMSLMLEAQGSKIRNASSLANSMEAVAQAMCDIVVKLEKNVHICSTSSAQETFFGKDMRNRSFKNVVDPRDAARFGAVINQVDMDSLPHHLPVTLRIRSKKQEASLVVVCTGLEEPRYLVGVRCEQQDEKRLRSLVTASKPSASSLGRGYLAPADDVALPSQAVSPAPVPGFLCPQSWETSRSNSPQRMISEPAMSSSMAPRQVDPLPHVAPTGANTFSFFNEATRQHILRQQLNVESSDDGHSLLSFKSLPGGLDEALVSGGVWKPCPGGELGLGTYTRVALVGRGGQGTVSHVRDENGQDFALKRIGLPGRFWQTDFPARLRAADREVRLLKSLAWASEVVVQLHECWLTSDHMCAIIVMEWMPKSLETVVQERHTNSGLVFAKDVCRWLVHMAYGIAAIHSAGWIHRDVKTSNMLTDEDGRVCKISDLGLGRQLCTVEKGHTMDAIPNTVLEELEESVDSQSLCSVKSGYTELEFRGTTLYMSPEAKAAGGHYGKASDIFGIGCVLLEILIGQDKFQAAAENGISERVAQAALEAHEPSAHALSLSLDSNGNILRAHLKDLCLQLVTKNWQDRPTTSSIIAKEFLRPFATELRQKAPALLRVLD